MLNRKLMVAACALMIGAGPVSAALPSAGDTAAAQKYIEEAQREIAAGNLRVAEIDLKNAVKATPDDPAPRVLLSELYLRMGDAPAAEAEVRLARQHGASEESTAAALGRALLFQRKYNQLFQQVQPGNRAPTQESAVDVVLGLAHLGLGEIAQATPLLDKAERLNPDNLDAKLAQARLSGAKRDVPRAESEVDAVLAKQPKRLDALTFKAQLLRAKGDNDGALARFNEVLGIDPKNVAAHIGRGNILVAQGKLDDAMNDANAVLSQQQNDVDANYMRALIFARQQKYAEADSLLQKINQQAAQFPWGLYLQGAVKFQLRQYEQADALLTKSLAREPSNTLARRLLAQVALQKRDTARAISTLQPALDADPNDPEVLALMAQAYAGQRNLDKALEYFQKAAALRPDDFSMQTRLAMLRLDSGQTDQAFASLEELSRSAKSEKLAAPVLVLSALNAGKLPEAASAAENLVKNNPDDSTALNLLGMVRVSQRNYADAEKLFNDVLKRDGTFVAARRNLAALYLLTDRTDDARKTYKQILEANPADKEALMNLAGVAAKEKKIDEAAQFLTQAIGAAPTDPAPAVELMRLYVNQKDWQKAKLAGKDLQTKFPANVPVLQAIAQMQAAAGDTGAMVASFKRVTELAPKSAPAWAQYAAAQVQAKDMRGAHASLMEARALAPSDPRIKGDLVNLDYQADGVDAALKTAKSFANDDPVSAAVLAGTVLQRAGRSDEALAVLTTAQSSTPDTQILLLIATLQRQKGQSAEADRRLQDWLKQNDDDATARLALAEGYLAERQYDPALAEFERLSKAGANNVVILNNLSWLYQQKNDPRARETAEKAYNLAPNQPVVADTLGWIVLTSGDTAKALPILQKAAAAATDNLEIQYHFAVALQRSGQADQARNLLQRIVSSQQAFDSKEAAQKLLGELQRG